MNRKEDVREFLIARRANLTPDQVGLPSGDDDRRVPGLRREEVAELAGVSIDYYTKLERGSIRNPSDNVLNAVSGALQLDDVQRQHLFDLFRRLSPVGNTQPPTSTGVVRPSVRRVLDNLLVPAVVMNAQQDFVAANDLGRALFEPHFDSERPNIARFIFLDSRAHDYYADWPLACRLTAATLRFEAGRDPLNSELTALIGELSTRSPQFRSNWADQQVHEHRTGRKVFRHPQVGELDVNYDVFEMPGEPGLSVAIYTCEPDSVTAQRMGLLASWAASHGFEHTGQRQNSPSGKARNHGVD